MQPTTQSRTAGSNGVGYKPAMPNGGGRPIPPVNAAATTPPRQAMQMASQPASHPLPAVAQPLPAPAAQRFQPPAFLIPDSYEAIERLADKICAAGWVPKSYLDKNNGYKPNKAMVEVGIMHGLMVGLPPLAALQSIAVINGMPSVWGDGMLALVRDSGMMEDHREWYEGEGEDLTAFCEVRRRGAPTPMLGKFSYGMAKRAGLTKKEGPWIAYPARMMQMRARAFALRDAFADILKGLRCAEEVIDGGDLVVQPDGSFAAAPPPPRPTRDQFTSGANAPTIENEEPEEPKPNWPMIDQFGEVSREYDHAGPWLDDFRLLLERNPDHAAAIIEHNEAVMLEVAEHVEGGPDTVEWVRKTYLGEAMQGGEEPGADEAGEDQGGGPEVDEWLEEHGDLSRGLAAVTDRIELDSFLDETERRVEAMCKARPDLLQPWSDAVEARIKDLTPKQPAPRKRQAPPTAGDGGSLI